MALKDLVGDRSKITEEAIERIVLNYVQYDPTDDVVAFTPAASSLSAKQQVLVYLTALQGWPFVREAAVPTDAKPAEIESATGIPGGTLRPTLRRLAERHLLLEKGGRYSARPAAFAAIEREVQDVAVDTPAKGTRRRGSRS
jgi:hypothetical protein